MNGKDNYNWFYSSYAEREPTDRVCLRLEANVVLESGGWIVINCFNFLKPQFVEEETFILFLIRSCLYLK